MPRLPRSALPDGFFHVYCRGVAKSVAFRDGDDRSEFLRLLGGTARRSRWELYAACVLSTHYHLVFDAPVDDLSKGMHQLNWRYALYYNERYETFGHVFAERFKTRAIEDEARVLIPARTSCSTPSRRASANAAKNGRGRTAATA
jgi:REP-associated tyrosine transposase